MSARLPSASTCFNLLKLPAVESLGDLSERLERVVQEGRTGFGFS